MLKVDELREVTPKEERRGEDDLLNLEWRFENVYWLMSQRVYDITHDHGFWDQGVNRNQPEMIALMHSELSEALEALRKDPTAPDKHCPDFTNLEVELADCIIRIMDFGHAYKLRVAEALCAKVRVNAARPHKHGKKF